MDRFSFVSNHKRNSKLNAAQQANATDYLLRSWWLIGQSVKPFRRASMGDSGCWE